MATNQGNIEYKLQLLQPSPARFARLVTQLKWRLLEGGGQAYYELGVADSGALIGLPRAELEMSLETLETMAGEIGASVIVVKEIEVREIELPAAIPDVVTTEEYGDTPAVAGAANGSRKRRSACGLELSAGEDDSNPSSTEFEQSSVDTDSDSLSMKYSSQSSSENLAPPPQEAPTIAINLVCASVYKPRPVRYRQHPHPHLAHTGKRKGKKLGLHTHVHVHASGPRLHGIDVEDMQDAAHPTLSPTGDVHDAQDTLIPTKQHVKATHRRLARDRRREKRLAALASSGGDDHAGAEGSKAPDILLNHEPPPILLHEQDAEDLTASLDTLHASLSITPATAGLDVLPLAALPVPLTTAKMPASTPVTRPKNEPRFIVEALVVRKLSLEEAFLDFGGFSLAE
jgi:hypothetical protein